MISSLIPSRLTPGVSPARGRCVEDGLPASLMAVFLAVLVLFLVPAAIAGAQSAPPAVAGVQWRNLTLDEALQEARERNTMVLVDVWAVHCHSCGDMDVEVWETPEGVELTEGLIPIKIDTQTPAGREFMKRYPVTGLPATIVLHPDGAEMDRVEGYTDRNVFLQAARPLHDGIDPLPGMEEQLRRNPGQLPLLGDLLERYLFRKRMADADSVYQRILRLDPDNTMKAAEKAISKMARFEENFTLDYAKAAGYYKELAERYPTTPTVTGGVNGAHKALMKAGRSREWIDWICPLLEKYPDAVYLHRTAAMTAWSNGFRNPCFANAARVAARDGGRMASFLDSIAVIMDGKPAGDGR